MIEAGGPPWSVFNFGGAGEVAGIVQASRQVQKASEICNHTEFHIEKLKDLTCIQEYVVTVSNPFGIFETLEDLVELCDTLCMKLLRLLKNALRSG